ncbi:MAG: DUF61 family protein [Candidatus Thorarchaeota archaeon]
MSPSIDRLIEHEIDTLNDHLPETRVTLQELTESGKSFFITRSGEKSIFRKEEIEWLREQVPNQYHDSIRLPIVILRRLDHGLGIYTVAGNKTELFMIHRVLGYVNLEWKNFATWKPIEQLARPQVQFLRKKMPSTSCIGIVHATREKAREDVTPD